jgi:putative transposase
VPTQLLPPTGQETGIDVGLASFATLANGERILTPGCYHKVERYLAKCQRRVSRRQQGSTRRWKAVQLLAKAHQTVRRPRQDFHHNAALSLVRAYDTLSHEDVQTANLLKQHHRAKSISDAGGSAFLAILRFTAANAGRTVVAVNPAFTSQSSSGCGVVVATGLSVRWHACPHEDCGASLHRDHNAAKNIERRGQRLRGGVGLPASGNREPMGLLAPVECQYAMHRHPVAPPRWARLLAALAHPPPLDG